VVFIMTDDHGAWATGYNGCMHTPNVDALAKDGVRFANAFAATPVCSPSRMTYITGKMPCSHGVQDFLLPADSFGPESRRFLQGHLTWTELFAKAGYTMGMCGKWHMGHDDQPQAGFTWWATVPGGGGTYRDPVFVRNGKREKLTGYKTDLVTDSALEFLGTVRDKPFVLMMPYYAPHTPFDYVPEPYTGPYENSAFSCFPDTSKHPGQHSGLATHHGNRASKRAYSGLISGVDTNVARVIKRLEETGARENTVVILTADQGWNAGHHGVWGKGNGTWPYNMYEQSIRVPMIWNHPARIKPGRTVDAFVSSYDLFPTLLDYCGLPAAPREVWRVGRSYAGFASGNGPRQWRDRLYFEYSYVRSVRTRNLKLVQRASGMPSELYDLEADPGEERNVFADESYARRRTALESDIAAFFRRIGAPALDEWRSTTNQQIPKRG
jgi:arylsulfatase A-like enzyme